MSDTGPPDDPTPPEVTIRRPGPPPPPSEGGSPYDELGELGGNEPWPLDDPGSGGPPRTTPSSLPPFLVGLIVGLSLAAVSIVGFLLFRRDDGGSVAAPIAETTTTTTGATTSTVTTLVIPTTEAPATTLPPVAIAAVGDPLALEDLAMGSSGLGDLTFGDAGDTVLGRLVATFGQPNEDTGTFISSGDLGTCDGDPIRFVRWGPLGVIILNPDTAPTFAAYRLDLDFGDLESLAAELRTVSGLRAGDTVETLEATYADTFTVTYEVDPDLGLGFQLRGSDGSLLLHGPVTSAEPDGRVSGIYSRDACGT